MGVDVAMALVGVVEGAAALRRDVGRQERRHRPRGPGQRRAEVAAVDVLHGQERVVADPAEVEHRHHVLVAERHRQLGLAHEQVEDRRVAGPLAADALDHQPLLEPRHPPAGQVDLGHAAASEHAEQLVAAEHLDHPSSIARLTGRGPSTIIRPCIPVSGPWSACSASRC